MILIMEIWRFDAIYFFSHTNSVQDKRKHRKREYFFDLQQMIKMYSIYSLDLFLKLGTALFCGKFSHGSSCATFNSETVFGFG